jgi:hypothetical protein
MLRCCTVLPNLARFRNNSGPGAPPDIFKLWLFNITNLEEVRQGGRPVLVGDSNTIQKSWSFSVSSWKGY